MTESLVTCELKGHVGVISLNAPERLNALSNRLLGDLRSALTATARNNEVRSLILTGTGRAFCVGADLQEAGGDADVSVLETTFHPLLRRLREFPVPIVSAVNGPAVGAGMSLALVTDLLVASEDAYFMQAFRSVGLVPDCGSTWLLPRAIGRARAVRMSLTGERIPARLAQEWGMAAEVVPPEQLLPRAMEFAQLLAAGPSNALRRTRELYWRTYDSSFEEQISLEDQLQREAVGSPDFKEGVNAFMQRRPPMFSPRSGDLK